MSTITIDYGNLAIVAPFIFAAVGILRGFAREIFTSAALLVLNYIILHPSAAQDIMDIANRLLNLFNAAFQNGVRFSAQNFVTAYSEAAPVVTQDNSYQLFVLLLIAVIVVSYLVGGRAIGGEAVAPLFRILGGLLGYLNGVMVIALVKEYLLGNFLKSPEILAAQATAVPNTVAIEIQNVPSQAILPTPMTVILLGIVVVVMLMLVLAARFGVRVPIFRR